jgi:uncharacterized protein
MLTPFAGSPIAYGVVLEPDGRVEARDGVALSTDVYRPALGGRPAQGRFPALLERTPYDKRRPVLHQAGHFFASRGYVFVSQDVRGRHGSEGEWSFLSPYEGPDGYDTLAWILDQPWCDGGVGTLGLSYSTATQQALAVLDPPGLKAQFLSDGGYSYFHRTVRHAGAFELGVMLPYVVRLARESRELARDPVARDGFERELDGLRPWLGRLPLRAGASFLRHAPSEEAWFLEMLSRACYDAYWSDAARNLAEHLDDYPDVPVFLQTSWYGHHVWATLEKYRELGRRHKTPKRLLIGHWLHGYDDYARPFAGEVDFGAASLLDSLNDLRLRWFDRWLKGLDTGIDREAEVRVFVMGGGSGRRTADGRLAHGGRWREAERWPLPGARALRLYLHGDGRLRRAAPAAGAPPRRYSFDPADPVPSVGGGVQNGLFPALIQGGAFDQRGRPELWACRDARPLAERADVLVFESEPLERDLEVAGPVSVRLWVSSSAPDTDFTAKLVDVHPESADWPQGFAMNLTDGILRLRFRNGFEREELASPGASYEISIEPQPVANLFKAGHRIRLDVSSSNFPRFDVNPNTGEPLGRNQRSAVAENAVHLDADHASWLELLVIAPTDE